jgi:hypothetical protein
MLTKLRIHNFKRFDDVEIELGNPVVFIGPNNSGKTAALQALALWDIGIKRWIAKRSGKTAPEKRPGVTINRRDLIAIPVPDANLLWKDLHVRDISRINGAQQTRNIRIDIEVDGILHGKTWSCGLEFDYANEESFYCRPLRTSESKNADRMIVPEEAGNIRLAYLPPMSGLSANETRLDQGAINVRLGEGRTAEVLRNLCYQLVSGPDNKTHWSYICQSIEKLFGVSLEEPQYIAARGEITMTYRERSRVGLDLSSSGRGLQQTLLLLTHLALNPGSVLLLDEPDAHLEVLRQREIYRVLVEYARNQDSQIIVASHSEIVLNEAAETDVVVAFLGNPHRINDRGSQLLNSLRDIGFDQYYQAAQTGWVLYLEGSTDLAILKSFAEKLDHPAAQALARPFVYYVRNEPSRARSNFHGLREGKNDLVGVAIFDNLEGALQDTAALREYCWQRREIENYLLLPEALLAWAEKSANSTIAGPLFESSERTRRRQTIKECIDDLIPPAALRDSGAKWWKTTKASDDFLDPLFAEFFKKLGLPNLINKANYYEIIQYIPIEKIDPEITRTLDIIQEVAMRAKPGESR